MVLLSVPFEPHQVRRPPAFWLPGLLTGAAALAIIAICLAIETLPDARLRAIAGGVAGAAVHAGFLAMGWIAAVGRTPTWKGLVARLAGVLLLASVASRFTAWGALVYLLPPILVLREGGQDTALRAMGVTLPADRTSIAVGLGAGTFLGVHLLISASQTFGYSIRMASVSHYLAVAAYDIGANALTAEWLFRGALFSRWWRRWEFWPAAAASTALAVGRYLLDPALPPALEVRAGALFYMVLLGVSACALRARTGSLLPGYLATAAFFLTYRMLAQ